MKTLYIDCGMGAAGDMLAAALIELLPDKEAFISELNALGIPGVEFGIKKCAKCGITGTEFTVTVNGTTEEEIHEHHHDHEHEHHHHDHHDHDHHDHHDHHHDHHHSGMHEITHIVSELHIPENVKEDVLEVYQLIAEAESHAHGVPVTDIHFHEVGTMDAIADITAVCLLMDRLSPDEVYASPVHVGCGQVKCAHGILPVPAPATAYILKGVPVYGGSIEGELCTPTGAALLKHFVKSFGRMPVMSTDSIGYGMGKKDFEAANCLRVMLGESDDKTDEVLELSCNVDDMTAEAIAFAMERLFEAGAHEVYAIPIVMKKSRPGTLIRVMCKENDREKLVKAIFKYTTTIGVRESVTRRFILERGIETLHTEYGDIRCKHSSGYGVTRSKFEYDDLSKLAESRGISLDDARKLLEGLER